MERLGAAVIRHYLPICLLLIHSYNSVKLTLKLQRVASRLVVMSIRVTFAWQTNFLEHIMMFMAFEKVFLRLTRFVVKQAFIQQVKLVAGIGTGLIIKT